MKAAELCVPVWVDHREKIVSFHEVKDFQRVEFEQREHLLAFMELH